MRFEDHGCFDDATVSTEAIELRRLDGTPLSQPPQVHGIPYPWTPLTWAILHGGGTHSRERD